MHANKLKYKIMYLINLSRLQDKVKKNDTKPGTFQMIDNNGNTYR